MAYTADVNRWRGPEDEPYRPHMLESPWHPGWIAVTVLGFIIWGDIPRTAVFVGAGLILAAGAWLVATERRQAG